MYSDPSGATATPLARSEVGPRLSKAKVEYSPLGFPFAKGTNTTR